MRRLILGTAGHIDHGKTSLVRALTGTDTDRLSEEKERGITIDLGFAELELEDGTTFGIVDVPGHEAFIRNMLAGASGIDLVALAVAADEGVMPQTREHLAIVELLGVRAGVVALTKTDTVEPEWLELALDDVRDALADTPFASAPIVPVSSTTGEGLDALRAALGTAAQDVHARAADDLFRLAVDRVFTVRGTGTVVTGTVWNGRIEREERVRVLPSGLESRVRGVQVHGEEVEEASAGQRAAIALAGVDRQEVSRGDVVVNDDAWEPTRMITARLTTIHGTEWTIEHRQRVRFHLGSAEVMARVAFLDPRGGTIGAGESAWVQLRLEAPVVARAGDRFVIRSFSPVTTIGGGTVAEPVPPKRRRLAPESRTLLESILTAPPDERIEAVVHASGRSGEPIQTLPVRTPLPPAEVTAALERLGSDELVVVDTLVFSTTVVEEARRSVLSALDTFHAEHPLRIGIDRELLRQSVPAPAPAVLVEHVLDELSASGVIRAHGALTAREGYTPHLTAPQRAVRDQLVQLIADGQFSPPTLPELPEEVREHPDFWPLLKLLEHTGQLVLISGELYMDPAVVAELVEAVRTGLAGRGPLGPTDFRTAIPVSRKYLIPILEYLDQAGITARKGEGRVVVRG